MFRPLLACKGDHDLVRNMLDLGPVYLSEKIDGIRCLLSYSVVCSRSLKPIKNDFVRENLRGWFDEQDFKHDIILDGELISGNFNESSSCIMTKNGTPKFKYLIFDVFNQENINQKFEDRLEYIRKIKNYSGDDFSIEVIPQVKCNSFYQYIEFENKMLDNCAEGVMVRRPGGLYKQGRSTKKSLELVKVKPLETEDAVIIEVTEKMRNDNVEKINELGYTVRSSSKENLVGTNTLGAFVVKGLTGDFKAIIFKVGTGFDSDQREKYFNDSYIGKIITYDYQKVGSITKPRIPVFKGFRDKEDM